MRMGTRAAQRSLMIDSSLSFKRSPFRFTRLLGTATTTSTATSASTCTWLSSAADSGDLLQAIRGGETSGHVRWGRPGAAQSQCAGACPRRICVQQQQRRQAAIARGSPAGCLLTGCQPADTGLNLMRRAGGAVQVRHHVANQLGMRRREHTLPAAGKQDSTS